jgi:molybdopterin synthase sulfur carrier subunit
MSIEVKFFASLRDELGCADYRCELPSPATLAALIECLGGEFGAMAQALSANGVRIALNQTLVAPDVLLATPLRAGDEVAFLPPVTGG